MNKEELNYLSRKWTHSFEEDADGEVVYRPASHNFPRSRGRAHLDLHENGEIDSLGIGRDDRPEQVKGSWSVDGDRLTIRYPDGGGKVYRLKEVKANKLVLKL